jgi:PAS domain S-box-containing protein
MVEKSMPRREAALTDLTAVNQYDVFDFMPGFVCILRGSDHTYEYVNEAYKAISGPRDFLGRTVRQVFPELEGQGFYEHLDGVYATGMSYAAQATAIHLEGEDRDRYIDLVYNAMRDANGSVNGIFVGGYDVTDAYRAQEHWRALAKLSDRLRASEGTEDLAYEASKILGRALGVSRVGYGTIDDLGDTLHVDRDWVSAGVESLAGSTPLRNYGSFVDSLRRDEFIAIADVRTDERTADAAQALESKSARSFVNVPVIEDGRLVAVLYVNHAAVRNWAPDELTLIKETAERLRTAMQRRRNEAALRESEEGYRTLFDAIDEGFCIIEFLDGPHGPLSDFVHVQANAAYARHAGIADVVGQRVRDMVPQEADSWVARYGEVLRTGQPIRFEQELVATGRILELAAVRIEPPTRRQVAVLFQDVTARRLAEEALRQSEEQFRVFAQAVPNHVWAATPGGELYWFNDQVYAYTGAAVGSLNGVAWIDIVHPDDIPAAAAAWSQALQTGEVYETQFRIRRGDGTYRWFLVRAESVRGSDGAITKWIGTNTDIENTRNQAAQLANLNATLEQQVQERTAELFAAEEALRQSQKMEAVGQLTGGLAHDFNNILAGIGGSLEMMSIRLAQGRISDLDRYITGASGATKRAANLTQRLLAFSRRQTLDPKPTNLNHLVNGMLDLINRSVGPEIEVETTGAVGLWTTFVDGGQLENALLNLCINARDAMPHGGQLTIETANRWMDDRTARERDLQPGQYVSLCVSDSGTGMTPDVVARAFEPFYTTKPIGQGTGLGLSMVYGFAGQSGGSVKIYSEIAKGTMICLYLPRHAGELEVEQEGTSEVSPRSDGRETILLVDDEPLIRMVACEDLQDLGYHVIEAGDGPSALRILNSDLQIDLLITDVGLPNGMNGRQLADAARVQRPELKVLFITGYAENAVISHGHLEPGMHVMTKPFQIEDFARRVKELIVAR